MEIESIYLHGGLKGFSFINDSGTQKEYDSFFKRFYDKIVKSAVSIQKIDSVNKNIIVESQVINGRQYYDYTFMEYYIYDVSGRPSYIGITIRLNALYLEILELYFILDTVFRKDIIGNLLMPKESTFICTNEQIDKALFDKVMKDIVQLCGSILQDSNLKPVRAAIGDNSAELNLVDCLPNIMEKYISKYSRVLISTDAPLQREIQNQNEIEKLNQQWTNKWNDLQNQHDTAQTDAKGLRDINKQLTKQLSQKQDALQQAQNELQQVQNKFTEFKKSNELRSSVIDGLKAEKEFLSKIVGFIDALELEKKNNLIDKNDKDLRDNKRGRHHKGISIDIRKLLPYIITIVIVAIGCYLFFGLKGCSDNLDDTSKQIVQLGYNPSTDLSEESKVTTASSSSSQTEEDFLQGLESETLLGETIDVANLTIDVKEFTKSKKYMEMGNAYTIRVFDTQNNELVNGVKGRWEVQVGDFTIASINSIETLITPIKKGENMEVKFYVEGNDVPLNRLISVK